MKLQRHESHPDLRAYYGSVARATNGRAQEYVGYIQQHQRVRLDTVMGFIHDIGPQPRALELGCGEGVMTARLADYYEAITAVDFIPEFIAECPTIPGVTFEVHDVERWTPRGRYDVVTACEILEHLVDPVGLLRRLRAHTTYVIASCPINEELTDSTFDVGWIDITQTDAGLPGAPAGAAAGHVWAMDEAGFRSMFDAAGYRIERFEVPFPSAVIRARA